METALQVKLDVAFGFFDDLSLEEKDRVTQILYGPKGKEPELPWEALAEPESCDAGAPDAAPQVHDVAPHIVTSGFCVAGPHVMPIHQPSLPVNYPIMYLPQQPFWEMSSGIDMPAPQAMSMPTGPMLPRPFPVMPLHIQADLMQMSGVKTVPTHDACLPNIVESAVGRVPDPAPGFPVMDGSGQSHDAPGYMPSAMSKAELPSGRPYERRNKKKRPMDYYRKLEARQSDVPRSGLLVNGDIVTVNLSEDADVRLNDASNVIDNVDVPANKDIAESDASCQHKPTHICVAAGGDASSGADMIKSPAAQSSDFSISNQLFSDDSRTDSSVKSTPADICSTDMCVQPSGSGGVSSSDETVLEPSTGPSVAISTRSTDGDQTLEKVEDESKSSSVLVASPESQPGVTEVSSTKTIIHDEVVTTKQAVNSWAGLFKGRPSAAAGSTVVSAERNARGTAKSERTAGGQDEKEIVMPMPVPVEQDTAARQLGQILLNHKVCHRAVPLLPRGLCNRGNWCYVNATLQALLACPPFYHLLKAMPSFPALSRGPSSTPVIDSLVEFVNEFSPMSTLPPEKTVTSTKGGVPELHTGPVLEPVCVYKMLQVIKYGGAFKHGRQEDAEEFLGCVLDSLHEEMAAAMDLLTKDKKQTQANGDGPDVVANGNAGMSEETSGEDDEDGQWEEVKPRGGKGLAPRSNNYSSSPTSDIFRGQIRSILHQSGARESPTLQPFYTLQLDIQSDKVRTLKDALDGLVSRESLQGYTCAKTKQQVEATRRILLEKLPVVLILHLKCFVYDKSGGCQKITHKQIEFPVQLEMSKDLLSPTVKSKYSFAARKYKLFAVVNHHGARAIGGHYTTDVYHPGVNGWIRMDDSGVKHVLEKNVLKQQSPTVPYLLYYRNVDTT